MSPDSEQSGVHLVRIDDTLYAVSGQDVRKLAGDGFVPASLPLLPGLERPWELEARSTALGSLVWTSRQLWWRRQGGNSFQRQRVSSSRVPGFAALALHGDGRLRLAAWDSLLQFDPEQASRARTVAGPARSAPVAAPGFIACLIALAAVAVAGVATGFRVGIALRGGDDGTGCGVSLPPPVRHNEAWSEWRAD